MFFVCKILLDLKALAPLEDAGQKTTYMKIGSASPHA